MNKNLLSLSVRNALALTVGASFLISAPALAQQSDNNEPAATDGTERIQVTGSRIARPELSQAAPIFSIGSDEIANFGSPDLGQILAELPAIGATNTLIGNNTNNSSAGMSSADLRRLGASRTLVLVNGKRHVAGSPGSASVDLSTIPAAMIERVEVMTGGASAIYGSDAVSGVINVITRSNFEGVEVSGRGTTSTEGVGARTHQLDLLAGGDFLNGRGNITFNMGLNRIQETMESDIRQYDNWGSIINPADTGRLDGIPDRIYVPGIGTDQRSGGGVLWGPDGTYYGFFPDGSWQVQPDRAGDNSAGYGWFPDGCETCGFTGDYRNFQPEVNRRNIGSTLSFELNDAARFYADFKYVEADIIQQFQPMFDNLTINVADNPYLDEDLRTILLDQGAETVQFRKFFEDWGNRYADNRRQTFRTVLGLDGVVNLGQSFVQYDLYYGYGETRNDRTTNNEIIRNRDSGISNANAAVDAIRNADGDIVCRDADAGLVNNGGECVPYNPFGINANPEAVNFMTHNSNRRDVITQEYVGATFVTDSAAFFELPGGPIDVAFGFEWREETSGTKVDAFTQAGLSGSAASPDTYGEYDVTEGFVEVNLPLLAGLTGIEELSVDMAYRTADYSHSGSADAWKIGLMYAPIQDLRLRGTIGQAVRAPNITEAFSPVSPGFVNVNDPCDASRINQNPNRAENCAALGVPTDFIAQTNASIQSLSGGNENLDVESSRSWTAGVVWTPAFIEGFTATLDVYDIQIDDAIVNIGAQTIIDNCVDSTGGPSVDFCPQVTRGADSQLTMVTSGYVNASSIETRGVELDLNYRTDLSAWDLPGRLSSSLFVNYLDAFVSYEFQDQPHLDNVNDGQIGDPTWQFRMTHNYRMDDWSITWVTRYIDRSALYNVTPRLESYENVGPAYVGSQTTHDLSATYYMTQNLTLNAGVRNLFDKVPPGYVSNPLYDLVGRRIFAGFKYSF